MSLENKNIYHWPSSIDAVIAQVCLYQRRELVNVVPLVLVDNAWCFGQVQKFVELWEQWPRLPEKKSKHRLSCLDVHAPLIFVSSEVESEAKYFLEFGGVIEQLTEVSDFLLQLLDGVAEDVGIGETLLPLLQSEESHIFGSHLERDA